MFKSVDPKQSFPDLEHRILNSWEEEGTFKKSLEKNINQEKFVFFDGPPFANGLPHYGHILANSLKDAVTRYFSMKGYYVPRTNGWDCHGLPVEYEIEKELGLSGKKDIEKMGVEEFNNRCRESVFRYTREWETLLKRIARWVDFDDSYATLENRYMESIWYVFKQIWEKEMVYQSHKSMHICPRCETPLSNFEVSQGYKEITDFSVIAKFKLKDEDTYILAWTTTPWTLPGNSGLAMGPNIAYVKVEYEGENLILAKDLLVKVFGEKEFKIIEEIEAKKLEEREYEPLFDYYKKSSWEEGEKPYRIVLADFVTVEDGTGIVHIAPAFGEDDLEVGKKNKLPIIQHVATDGCFKEEVTQFAGKFVKGQDQNVAKYLEEKGLLFSGQNYRHSYPHCWRCDTPLLNYSTKSWFIRVTDIKDKLLENNQKIHWQPAHIKEGRFGKWLENARDWSISRNRFWGCAIPVWECKCGNRECVGSTEELLEKTTNAVTEVVVARHGQTDWNLEHRWQGQTDIQLNETGIKQAHELKEILKNEDFEVVYSSDLSRAKQTAEIIVGDSDLEIKLDEKLREKANGKFEGLTTTEIIAMYEDEWKKRLEERHEYKYPDGDVHKGESGTMLESRAVESFKKIINENKGKKILIVAHEGTLRVIKKYFDDLSVQQMYRYSPKNCEFSRYKIVHKEKYPEHFKGDLHKPYIDDVKISCSKCSGDMERIPEVLDCWFESGAMPYAQLHYPFENKNEFEANFPANFIAEGLDQTRGWFYTLHVLSTILFEKNCFENVIVNGILLAADGEKLSKRKKNYPDPNVLFETKGVDATRFFLYSSTAPLAQDVRFSEQHVDEVVKKLLLTLWNCYSFFVTYSNIDGWHPNNKERVKEADAELDRWIISELNTLIEKVTINMDSYNLTEATRPITDFVDNLSNWYIRRSRRRFWKSENDSDKDSAYSTLYEVLLQLTKIMAPFTPYISDEIHRNLSGGESVHLQNWPQVNSSKIDKSLNEEISLVRKIINLGHGIRSQKRVKVRQPLALVRIGLPESANKQAILEQKNIILEELNIKELEILENAGELVKVTAKPDAKKLGPKYGKEVQKIIMDCKNGEFKINEEGEVEVGEFKLLNDEVEIGFEGTEGYDVASESGIVVILDTTITEELKIEGFARDIVRVIQDMRKDADYNVDDRITIWIELPEAMKIILDKFGSYICQETLASEIQSSGDLEWDLEKELNLDDFKIKIATRKIEK